LRTDTTQQGNPSAETHSQDGQQNLNLNWKHQFLQRYSNFYAKSWLEGSGGEVIHLYTKKTQFEIGKSEKVEAELWIRATKRIPNSSIKTRFYCKEQAPVFKADGFTRQSSYRQHYYFDQTIDIFGNLSFIEPGEHRFPFLIDFPATGSKNEKLTSTYSNKKNTIYVSCMLDTTLDRSFPFPSIHATKNFRIVSPLAETPVETTTSDNNDNHTNMQQPTISPIQNNNTDNNNTSQQPTSSLPNDANHDNTDTTMQNQNGNSDTTQPQNNTSNNSTQSLNPFNNLPSSIPTPTTSTSQVSAQAPNGIRLPQLFQNLRMEFGFYKESFAPGEVAELFVRVHNFGNLVNFFY
jgi:hypothetical protein